jgi:hypothetical protein
MSLRESTIFANVRSGDGAILGSVATTIAILAINHPSCRIAKDEIVPRPAIESHRNGSRSIALKVTRVT